MSNSYGTLFQITSFGESHGPAIGVIVDGCPAGLTLMRRLFNRNSTGRKPGQSKITTQRKEDDTFKILSGVFEGKSTGTPIALVIENQDQRSKDYGHIAETFRPSHADLYLRGKYGNRDYRGGGRSSARETAARVAAGAIAKLLLLTAQHKDQCVCIGRRRNSGATLFAIGSGKNRRKHRSLSRSRNR